MAYYPPNGDYSLVTLTANIQLDYPYSANTSNITITDIMDVTTTIANLKIILPDATQSGPGLSIAFNNVGLINITIMLYDGTTELTTLTASHAITIYLYDSTTTNGEWRVLAFAGGTSGINNLVVDSPDDSITVTNGTITNPGGTINLELPSIVGNIINLSEFTAGIVLLNTDNSNPWSIGLIAGDSNITIDNGDGSDGSSVIVVKLDSNISLDQITAGNITIGSNGISNTDINGVMNITSYGSGLGYSFVNINGVLISDNSNVSNINNLSLSGSFSAKNVAKAWCRFTNTSGTIALISTYNVSSVTYDSDNYQYVINFQTAVGTNDYVVWVGCSNVNSTPPLQTRVGYDIIRTTSSVTIVLADSSGEMLDDIPEGVSVTIFSIT
jgi:hypothetical protein